VGVGSVRSVGDAAAGVEVRAVGSIEDVDAVFGVRGDPAHCWCVWDRVTGKEFDELDDAAKRERLAVRLRADGPAAGVIATVDGERVGWCSVAPRAEFGRVGRGWSTSSPQTAGDDPGVWSVTCFVVRPGFRRGGVADALLVGAIEHARAGGARILEAYPVDTSGQKAPSANLYRGTLSQFAAQGFEVVATPRPGRAIVRLAL